MRTILVVKEFSTFSEVLIENNFTVVNCPTIKTATLDDLDLFHQKMARLSAYDGVFITSVKSADVFLKKILDDNISYGGKVFILGRRSFDLLKNRGLNIYYDEMANNAREMLEILPKDELRFKKVLFLRGSISMRVIPDFFKNIAKVDEVCVYRTIENRIDRETFIIANKKLDEREFACVCFFSPSGADSFFKIFGRKRLNKTKVAAIGKTTAAHLTVSGVKVDFIPNNSTGKFFAQELTEYLNGGAN